MGAVVLILVLLYPLLILLLLIFIIIILATTAIVVVDFFIPQGPVIEVRASLPLPRPVRPDFDFDPPFYFFAARLKFDQPIFPCGIQDLITYSFSMAVFLIVVIFIIIVVISTATVLSKPIAPLPTPQSNTCVLHHVLLTYLLDDDSSYTKHVLSNIEIRWPKTYRRERTIDRISSPDVLLGIVLCYFRESVVDRSLRYRRTIGIDRGRGGGGGG